MSNVGSISIELELRDGDFVARSRRAGQVVRELNGSFGVLTAGMSRFEGGVYGTIAKLRDLAIVGHGVSDVIYGIRTLFIDWTSSINKASGELEKMLVLLEGLSKADSKEGRIKEAVKDMDYLIQKSQNAPFALNELTSAFVRMKTTGLSGIDTKLNALTNAIAKFGGTDESLHRASVAIQQMASKGVISMEELRQQLGEAVPNAMQLMADGMGVSMAHLVKEVSNGRVVAIPALEAMLNQMELSTEGSAQKMMKTWSGMGSQLDTEWTLLKKRIGDGGMFDESKDALSQVIELMRTGEAMDMATSFGGQIRDVIRGSIDLTKKLYELSGVITQVGEVAVAAFVGLRAGGIITSAAIGIDGLTKSVFALYTSLTAAQTVTIVPTMYGMAQAAQATQVTLTGAALATARWNTVLTALGGPIGLATKLIAAAGAAFLLFGDNLDSAASKASDAIGEMNDLTDRSGELMIFSEKSLQEQMERLETIKKGLDELIEKRAALDRVVNPNSLMNKGILDGGIEGVKAKLDKEIAASRNDLSIGTKLTDNARERLLKENIEKEVEIRNKGYEKSLEDLSLTYTKQMDIARKAMEEKKKLGQSQTEYEKEFSKESIQIEKNRYDTQIKMAEEAIAKQAASLEILKNRPEIKQIVTVETNVADKNKQWAQLLLDLADLERKAKDSKNVALYPELNKQIADKKIAINSLTAEIKTLESALEELRSQGGASYIDFSATEQQIDKLKDKVEELEKKKIGAQRSMGSEVAAETAKMGDFLKQSAKDTEDALNDYFKAVSKTYGVVNTAKAKLGEDFVPNISSSGALEQLLLGKGASAKEFATIMQKIYDTKNLMEDFKSTAASASDESDPEKQKDLMKSTEEYKDAILANVGALKEYVSMQGRAKDAVEATAKSAKNTADNEARARDYENDKEILPRFDKDFRIEEMRKSLEDEKGIISEANQMRLDAYRQQLDLEEQSEIHQRTAAKNAQQREKDKRDAEQQAIRDVKDRADREKWLSDQLNGYMKSIRSEEIAQMKDGVEASRVLASAKLEDIRRVAEATANANGLSGDDKKVQREEFVNRAVGNLQGLIKQDIREKQVTDHQKWMLDMESQFNSASINMIRDKFERERQLILEQERVALEANKKMQQDEDLRDQKEAVIHAQRIQRLQELERQSETSFEKMMLDPVRYKDLVSDSGVTFVDGMANAFAEMATNSKASFGNLTASILSDINKMIVKFVVLEMVKRAAGFLTSFLAPSSSLASAGMGEAALASGTSSFATNLFPKANGGTLEMFANGGMWASDDEMRRGGVAKTPKLAIFGEGKTPEAFMPMMANKYIPIESMLDENGNFKGINVVLPSGQRLPTKDVSAFANGGTTGYQPLISNSAGMMSRINDKTSVSNSSSANVNISINVDNNGGAKSSSQSDAGSKDGWSQFATRIQSMITKEIADQKRPGGLLYQ